jgi:hypothetical protein
MLTVSIRLAGNLHLNIAAAAYTQEIESALEPFVYELVGESLEPAIVIYVRKVDVVCQPPTWGLFLQSMALEL